MSAGKILIAGALAQRPGIGGHAWVLLQYLLGFRRLGFEVLFLDWFDDRMCLDTKGRRCLPEDSWNLQYLTEVMQQADLGTSWSLDFNESQSTFGISREKVLAAAREADLLLNVMGFLNDDEILQRAHRRAFLDIDPGFGQMWQDLGLARIFQGHDTYITIGENIGESECRVPTCGLRWLTTPQPVVLEKWPYQEPKTGGAFSGIVSWRGPFAPIEFQGRTYGLRVHEFRKFASLPKICSARFHLALEIDPSEAKDLAMLEENGWCLHHPRVAAGTIHQYQRFIQNSKAELMIAKNMYVASRSGWFSDRSICYLASGKPVLAQDTGFPRQYPVGQGLLAFTNLEEAAAGVEAICGNYQVHSRAARDLAETYFDSDKVLLRLLEKIQ